MTELITKTAFAASMGVHRSQATRWAAAGMPTAPDGRVDAAAASAWVRAHVDPSMRAMRGSAAVAERGADQHRRSTAADELARTGLWLLAQRVPGLVAEMAAEIGLPEATARRLHDLALTRASELANDTRARWMELPESERGPFRTIDATAHPVDWAGLAAMAAQHGTAGPASRRGRIAR